MRATSLRRFVSLGLLVVVVGCGGTPTPEPDHVSLQATATLTASGIAIRNSDGFAYIDVKVSILQGAFTFYRARGYRIEPGHMILIPYSAFVDENGTRFNYYTTRPQQVLLSCTAKGGKGIIGWQF
jgi:hypothetical protein